MITKILIYEEQKLFSGMLQFFINSQENLDVVGTFDDVVFLMEFLKLNEVHVILFGINKVNTKTCILLDELKRTFNNLKIIVLNDGLEIKEARKLNPKIDIIEIESKSGKGIHKWVNYLKMIKELW